MLTESQIASYRRDGLLFPIPILSRAEVTQLLGLLERLERPRGGRLPPMLKAKPHLLVPELWDLVMDPRIVEPVKALLGPDLLCFGTSFISKNSGDGTHVSWHQDATHWGLQEPRAITAWLALTPSTHENGCVQVLPGSHGEAIPHDHPDDPLNLLGRKELARLEIDESQIVEMELRPGEMSLHDALVVHGSQPNDSGSRRTGFAIRYIPAGDGQRDGRRGTATLVAGKDHGLYDLEERPSDLMDRAAMLRYRGVLRAGAGIIFSDPGR